MKWDESFSVQNTEMDKQHQKLFELLNNLNQAMEKGKGRETLPEIFNDLVQYTRVHFSAEETLLQKHNYPDLSIQKQQHQVLIAQISKLQEKFSSGDFSSSLETRDFLNHWLIDHIKGHDQKYGFFFKQKGIVWIFKTTTTHQPQRKYLLQESIFRAGGIWHLDIIGFIGNR